MESLNITILGVFQRQNFKEQTGNPTIGILPNGVGRNGTEPN